MEEIGKLIHELFNELRNENTELKGRVLKLEYENHNMAATLEKVTDIISALVVKSTSGDWYMQSLWGREFDRLIDLLGIELKEEKNDDDI